MSCQTIIHENRSYWSNRAATYSEVNREELRTDSHHRWQKLLDEKIRLHFSHRDRSDIHVLEIGTGPGFFSILLAELGYHVTAIDLTPNMLAEARRNAGDLADHITFMEMNAEQLQFPESSFDVILSRNLTWNLPHPEQAYSEWRRVLKPSGLLLNFDANWYHYLFDEKAGEAYRRDRENSAALCESDQNVGENFDIMEDIAVRVPLSRIMRPQWDVDTLGALGMHVTPDEGIWQHVWSEDEKINFASTPMFLVEARKFA